MSAAARGRASDPLVARSLAVLRDGQARTGALVASPAFPVYRYAWLRDGAFCAHALDLACERAAAAAFHRWVVDVIERHHPLVEAAIGRADAFGDAVADGMPPARYTLDGEIEAPGDEPWPNFQVDGYGTWLWAFARHVGNDVLAPSQARVVRLVCRYLEASWRLRCFNCWEELDGGEHASTLASVVAGLEAAARLLDDDRAAAAAETVRSQLLARFSVDGRFRRGAADDRVDGSLLWLAVPLGVLPLEDARVAATVAAVQRDLVVGGGVLRYRGDSYYGGGEWPLLTSSLACHLAVAGDVAAAESLQDWVRAAALPSGDLPEQLTGHAQQPEMVQPWVERWGPVATPLLWSHAMYLIAESALARHA